MFKVQPLGATCALLALACAAGCGSGHTMSSVPDAGVQQKQDANRVLTSRERKHASTLRAVMSKTPEQNIDDAVAHGARVFRVPTVLVYDPVSRRTFRLPAKEIHRTANGIVLFHGSRSVALSGAARVSTAPQYTYLFVRGSHVDPDAGSGAVRIR